MTSSRFLPLLLGLATLAPASGEELEFTLEPLGFIVVPPSKSPQTAYREWTKSDREFNDYFRAPPEPDGGIPVDCESIEKIGVTLIVSRSGQQTLPKKRLHIRHVWTHSDPTVSTRNLDDLHIRFVPRTVSRFSDWAILGLDRHKTYRSDGIWTLKSYVNDELAIESSFVLSNCERNRQLAIAELSAKEPDPAPEEEEDAVEIVCREEKATGSRIMTTMCREQVVMDRRRERDQDMIRDVQSTPGREPLQ